MDNRLLNSFDKLITTAADKKFMEIALDQARKGSQQLEGGPFGCCIVRNTEVIAKASNSVLKDKDPTAHAEINAIREASRSLGRYDLSDCIIYATTEPCPMCFFAIHWARIPKVIYGTSIKEAKELGFNEPLLNTKKLAGLAISKIELIGNFMHDECKDLFEFWKNLSSQQIY